MKRLTKADFAALTCPTDVVQVPGLSGGVLVRGMTGVERDAYEAGLFQGKGKNRDINMKNVRAKLVVACACDLETGERIWTDADVESVGRLPARVLNPIFAAAQKLSGISEEEIEEMGKPIEETAIVPTDRDGGSSSSPSPES